MDLLNARALVTGAGGGLGTAVCEALRDCGAKVVTSDLPGTGAEVEADLAVPGGAERVAEGAGDVDVLVNNAGIELIGAFGAHSAEELEAIVRVNLLAPMELIRLIVPGMQERERGHVVNMASLAGRVPTAWTSTYSATKHGLVGLTHALRAEYAESPVGFSVICPGFVSGPGMLGPHEAEVDVPKALGTLPASKVGEAVVSAIRDDRPEVVVNARPVKPIIGLAATAPGAAARLTERVGVNETWRQVGVRKGRI